MEKCEVGYKKPPIDTRFKKGVSGNKKGRPKRREVSDAEWMAGILDRLNAPVQYKENGKIKTDTRLELLLRQHAAEAVKGNVISAQLLLDLRNNASLHDQTKPYVLFLTRDEMNA